MQSPLSESKLQVPFSPKGLSFIYQIRSVAQSCPTLCDPMYRSTPVSLSITNSRSSSTHMSIQLVMLSSHLILCRPLLLLPPIPPSIRVFSPESTIRMRCPKYWSLSFNLSPSNEHPGLISFRMDWLDLLAVPGTLKSLLQHHSSKASMLWCSAFFTVNNHQFNIQELELNIIFLIDIHDLLHLDIC